MPLLIKGKAYMAEFESCKKGVWHLYLLLEGVRKLAY